jgi:preprotein translocase subunit Sec61beta
VTSKLLELRGADQTFGRQLHRLFQTAGLLDVNAEGHLAVCPGDSPGARLYQANIEQTRDQLVGAGLVTRDESERCSALLNDPDIVLYMPVLMAARGRLPEGAGSPGTAPR